jgi:hypothetical protein
MTQTSSFAVITGECNMANLIQTEGLTFLKSWGAIVIRYKFTMQSHIGMFVLGVDNNVTNQAIITDRSNFSISRGMVCNY